ncbi:hypothetical protein [Streptomyces longwoodensis]|uniref:hypothetical protein n=1 Tax=Streptomyces longwoodensis TaxID=68231 RepID=UPI00225515F5|nr:hypothetical protein [Streptomyces longwoodensis]MCX5001014.1 hypothetical protein [Streptomyces longwoodensis]
MFNSDAGHSHLPAPHFVTDCPMCDAAKAARNQAIQHLTEAVRLFARLGDGDQPTLRLNIAPIGVTGDDTGLCGSIDLTAKLGEALADAVDRATAYMASDPDSDTALRAAAADLAPHPADREAIPSGDFSAAAVAQCDPVLYAVVTDVFLTVDPQSYLDDVFAADDPHEAMNAYEQLVTGEWDGEL